MDSFNGIANSLISRLVHGLRLFFLLAQLHLGIAEEKLTL